MITQLHVKNFKSIKEANVHCNGINIIIGANNAGKSNILESLEYYSRSLMVPLEEIFGPGPFSFSQIFHKGSDINKEGIEIGLSFHGRNDTSHSYRIDSLRNPRNIHPKFRLEVIYELIQSKNQLFEYENKKDLQMREKGIEKKLPGDIVEMYNLCRSIRKFQFVPKEIKKEREIDPLESTIPFLKHNGENLVNVLFAMRDIESNTFRRILNDFQEIYPDVTGLSFTHLGDYRYALEFTREINSKDWVFLSPQVSDGFVITLAILTLIHLSQTNKIVLIEEIENGLNPLTLGKIIKKMLLISDAFDMQFFITTHSPVILDYLNEFPEFVLVCEQHDGHSEYTPLPEILKTFGDDYEPGESLVELWLEGLIGGL
jgi:AAA15 family ATPase/GTPase